MYIRRVLQDRLSDRLFKGKAIIIMGARQVGKSTLLSHLAAAMEKSVLKLNCDDPDVRAVLHGAGIPALRRLIGRSEIVFIDEAQRVPDIGLVLKMIIDELPQVQLLVSGSSSFELQRDLNEPLTGRSYEYDLYPLSVGELLDEFGLLEQRGGLEQRLIFGSYPDVVTHLGDARELLTNLSDSYLYKDILAQEGVRRPELLQKLLSALSLQVGSEVSYIELGRTVGADAKTIMRYIDLLEKCFVIFSLKAFSRNIRKEIRKGVKIYFYDNGVRNAVIRNYAPLGMRADAGALWENYCISERLKFNRYNGRWVNSYFWRTTGQQEIDYIEEADGVVSPVEFKWNPRKSHVGLPEVFKSGYDPAPLQVITPDNYIGWLT